MGEKFAEMMNILNKKPIEIQIKGLAKILEITVDVLHKFIDNYYIELEIINNKIIALETKNIDISDINALTPIPIPPPQNRPVGIQSVRTEVLGELKNIFKKHQEKTEIKENEKRIV